MTFMLYLVILKAAAVIEFIVQSTSSPFGLVVGFHRTCCKLEY